MIKYLLIVSLYSPGGELIRKYDEGPINTKSQCVTRLKEIQKSPDLYGLKYKLQCVRIKKEHDYVT